MLWEPQQASEPLTEDEFDIQRACGLLLLSIGANSIKVAIKFLNLISYVHNIIIISV